MTDRSITVDSMTEAQLAAATCDDPHEKLKDAQAHHEELIRGMAEMAERFTLRMDGAAAQIDELRECLILAVKELDTSPPVSIYTNPICARARKALGLI
jgi:hypothetical protein